MLLNQGIRTKLLAVLALPIVALMILAGVISMQAFGQAGKAEQVEELAQGSGALGGLVASLQAERSASVAFLEKRPVAAELKSARARTDAALLSSTTLIGSVDLASLSPQATAAVAATNRGHAGLKALRATVDAGSAASSSPAVGSSAAASTEVAAQYTQVIAGDIALPQRIGEGLADRSIGAQLTGYSTAQRLAELATQEREAGLSLIGEGVARPLLVSALTRSAALQDQAVAAFRLDATSAQTAALDTALGEPAAERAIYRDLRQQMLVAATGSRLSLNASNWRNATNERITALQSLARPLAAEAGTLAAEAASSARTRALAVLAGGLLVVAVMVLLGSILSRTITRPLRQLTEVAGRVRDELPLMTERMATPGDGPGVTLPEIPVTSNDEVGQLARAFRDVNATTLKVAEEQAALRGSIAAMFVNVARRNHVLLSRQLSFIDQLERTEENPDTLENLFRLDHLATRMRRNAESLIVLAGIDAGRRLRRPMPLSDVIRTAVSEIERYDRVDLALQADPPMVGHVALTTAHLLAELLENATQFSNPDTRVTASTTATARGIRVTVTDLGLGMTWDEITDANERIANPPMSDVVGSQRLGFYVVGRLARRLDATVELKPGRSQGTVVIIDLSPALFVPGSVVEVPGGLDEPLESDVAPDGDPGQVADGEPGELVASGPAPAELAVAKAAEPATDGGLPRRSGRDAAAAVESSAAVPTVTTTLAAPSAPTHPTTEEAFDGAHRDTGSSAPEPDPEPRSGIFSGFRARLEAKPKSAAPPIDKPTDQPLGLPLVDDSATPFVPELVSRPPADSTPAAPAPLARRAPRSVPESAPAEDAVPQRNPAAPAADAVPQRTPAAPLTLAEPPSVFAAQPQPTVPTASATPTPPAAAAALTAPAALAPLTAPAAPAQPPSVIVAQPTPSATPPLASRTEPDPGARSELRELAREGRPPTSPAPVTAAPSVAATTVPEVQPAPAPPQRGRPAMDILPAKSSGGRGSWLRRSAKATPVTAPLPPRQPPAVPVAAPAADERPAAESWAAIAEPANDRSPSAPQPAPGGGVPAPPSLFGSGAQPAPAASALPSRTPAAPMTPAHSEQAVPGIAAAHALRERSAMASEALSELSALSTYRPETVQAAPANLTRRTPQATPAGKLPPPPEPPVGTARPTRNAADVRSMLSGFQAGVERGRTEPAAARTTPDDDS